MQIQEGARARARMFCGLRAATAAARLGPVRRPVVHNSSLAGHTACTDAPRGNKALPQVVDRHKGKLSPFSKLSLPASSCKFAVSGQCGKL